MIAGRSLTNQTTADRGVHMTTDQTPKNPKRPWLLTALPAITFLLGAVIGGVVVAVASDSSGAGSDNAENPTTTSTPATPTSPTASSTTIVVPGACSDAADAASQAADLVRQGAAAVRDFKPKELNQVLDDLQTLDPKLQALAKSCSEVQLNAPSP